MNPNRRLFATPLLPFFLASFGHTSSVQAMEIDPASNGDQPSTPLTKVTSGTLDTNKPPIHYTLDIDPHDAAGPALRLGVTMDDGNCGNLAMPLWEKDRPSPLSPIADNLLRQGKLRATTHTKNARHLVQCMLLDESAPLPDFYVRAIPGKTTIRFRLDGEEHQRELCTLQASHISEESPCVNWSIIVAGWLLVIGVAVQLVQAAPR